LLQAGTWLKGLYKLQSKISPSVAKLGSNIASDLSTASGLNTVATGQPDQQQAQQLLEESLVVASDTEEITQVVSWWSGLLSPEGLFAALNSSSDYTPVLLWLCQSHISELSVVTVSVRFSAWTSLPLPSAFFSVVENSVLNLLLTAPLSESMALLISAELSECTLIHRYVFRISEL
jgi:hypothetical protein